MADPITDEEWEKLSPANFETHSLLRAVDAVDELRNDLNDGEYATPPQLRTDLLKLHQLAMARDRAAKWPIRSSLPAIWTSTWERLRQIRPALLSPGFAKKAFRREG